MENGELVIVPEAVQHGDVICLLLGTISACALRPFPDGTWALISGDCYIFTDTVYFERDYSLSTCDEYVKRSKKRVEEFRLR
jgi:hypothetical protein